MSLTLVLLSPLLLSLAQALSFPQPPSDESGEIFHVYPDLAVSNGSIPLYFALMQSFSGGYVSAGGIPGILVALDEINSNPYVLPGYTLHYTLNDNECERYVSHRALFKQLRDDRTKIAAVGSGCTLATEPAAEISHFWNISQISCHSSSPLLRDRRRFARYFQTIGSEENQGFADFGVIKFYGWKKVTILQLDVDSFENVTLELANLLRSEGVTVSIKTFEEKDGIAGLQDPFDDDTTIYAFIMYAHFGRELLCMAYEKNLMYPHSTFLHPAWWVGEWWKGGENLACSDEERERVVENSIAVLLYEYIEDDSAVAETGTNGTTFGENFNEYFEGNEAVLGNETNDFGQNCYDGMWILALALNKTMNDLNDPEFNANASAEASINRTFGLEDITYESEVVLKRIFDHLTETNFLGITGNISFDADGIRAGRRLYVYQNRRNYSSNLIVSTRIGSVVGDEFNFVYVDTENHSTVWPEGVPNDGIPLERITTVHLSISIIFGLLSAGGLVFCLVCLLFNIIFRQTKLIRLTSPNLNYIILAGAALLYVDIYFITLPKENETFATVSCHIFVVLNAIGYSLCFGTIMAKMIRIYYIFNNPLHKKRTEMLRDYHLSLFVCLLIVVDICILLLYFIPEGVRGKLDATKKQNVENSFDMEADPNGTYHEVIFENYIYTCNTLGKRVLLGVLYGYKAILQILTVVLALKTRKVKVKGLDDYKYIIMATYVSTFVLVVVFIFTFTIEDQVNLYAALTSFSFFLGSTVIVMLIFVPKMITLYRDPEGELVFSKTRPEGTMHDTQSHMQRHISSSEVPPSMSEGRRGSKNAQLKLEKGNSSFELTQQI